MTAVLVPMSLSLISFRKFIGFLFALISHIFLILLLLKGGVILPIEHIGHSTITRIISETVLPAKVETVPLKLQPLLFNIEPPQLDLPVGKPITPQPMVIIEAKFSPDVALIISATKYPPNLNPFVGIYRAQVSVQIFENGAVGDVHIESSDGNAALDNFITAYAESHWRFEPSLSDGVPSLSWKTVSIEVTEKAMTVVH